MTNCQHTLNTFAVRLFLNRTNALGDIVLSHKSSGPRVLCIFCALFSLRLLNKIVLKHFAKEWYGASQTGNVLKCCKLLLKKSTFVKDQLTAVHVKLSTLPSPVARWTSRRLIAPILDWKDLILDLSIATDPEIQSSLSELENLL